MNTKTKVIAITNYKGGVGKSTITTNLGFELEKLGYKVLMIDFDGQKNLTAFCGMKKHCNDNNIITALDDIENSNFDNLYPDPILNVKGQLDLITCDIRKTAWKNRVLSSISKDTIMKRYIDTLREKYDYDYILIDNAPSVETDLVNTLVAADEYLIVTEAEVGSVDAITTVVNVIEQVQKLLNPKLKPAGILVNKYDKRTTLHKLLLDVIKETWKDKIYIFETIIPNSIAVADSELMNTPVSVYNKNNNAAKAFEALTKEFVERTFESEDTLKLA